MIGTLTIGQAPRGDITPILNRYLPRRASVIHAGVLDGLTRTEIESRFTPHPGDALLITRLLDGSSVQLSKQPVYETLQQKLIELEQQGCSQILLLCTGRFDGLKTGNAWLIEPDHILPPTVAALMGNRQLGVIVPLASQAVSESGKFSVLAKKPLFSVASPYADETRSLSQAAGELRHRGADAVLLDCMGFTERHRRVASRASGLPVILSNALIAKLFAEFAG